MSPASQTRAPTQTRGRTPGSWEPASGTPGPREELDVDRNTLVSLPDGTRRVENERTKGVLGDMQPKTVCTEVERGRTRWPRAEVTE